MEDLKSLIPVEHVERTILVIRDKRIILDADLAKLYGVTTKRLNEQVKRNRERFPKDFMFQLKTREKAEVVANCDHLANLKFSRALPYAFTEHGAIMAASVLNTPRAIEASVFVVRAFVKMREMLIEKRDLAKKLAVLEEKLTERLDTHETAIVEVLKQVLALLNPPEDPPIKPKKKIGFEAKEPKAKYGKRPKRKTRNEESGDRKEKAKHKSNGDLTPSLLTFSFADRL